MGNVKLIRFSDNQLIFSESNLVVTKRYIELFGENPEVSFGEYYASFLSNYLSCVFGYKFNYTIRCKHSLFEVIFNISDEKIVCSTNKSYDLSNSNSKTSMWIQKLIINKKICSYENFLSINGKYTIGLPILNYINLLEKLFESRNYQILLGIVTSYGDIFAKLLDSKGLKTPIEKFECISYNWSLIGFGELVVEDFENGYFKLNTNIFSNFNDSEFHDSDFIKKFKVLTYSSLKGSYEFCFNIDTEMIIDEELGTVCFKEISDKREITGGMKNVEKLVNYKPFLV